MISRYVSLPTALVIMTSSFVLLKTDSSLAQPNQSSFFSTNTAAPSITKRRVSISSKSRIKSTRKPVQQPRPCAGSTIMVSQSGGKSDLCR
jgi:hypothetical protein